MHDNRVVIDTVRRSLQAVLREKIAGGDGPARAERIWGSEGERWFADADPVWRVHADASMFVGGVRALLLQSLHPLAMYGVAEHSGYQDDPWARVASTATYLAETTFATIEHAEEAIARIRRIHTFVTGTAPDGRAYSASDPELLMWVHVAEIDSFLTAYQRFGRTPLTDREADTYVAQAGVPAELLGVVDPPQDVAGLRAEIERFRPDLAVTPPAVDAARLVLHEPPLAWYGRPFYDRISSAAVVTLPRWARTMMAEQVRLPRTTLAEPLGRISVTGVSWVMGAAETRHTRDTSQGAPR